MPRHLSFSALRSMVVFRSVCGRRTHRQADGAPEDPDNVRRATGLLRSSTVGSEAGRHLLNALKRVVGGQNQSDGIMWSVNDAVALGGGIAEL